MSAVLPSATETGLAPPAEREFLSGNESVACDAFDAGVDVAAAYPGTPSTEIVETIATFPGVYAEWSTNEKVALEVAFGASMTGRRAITAMKHVGLNVASDSLMTLGQVGAKAGLVIAVSDDVGYSSSQNEPDSRFWGRFVHLPVLEPADADEAYAMTHEAFALSGRFEVPVLLRLTTRVSHVKRGRWQWIAWVAAGLGIIALLGVSFTRDDAAFYYRSSSMESAVRVKDEKAVLGKWELQVDEQAPVTPVWMPAFFQPVHLEGVSRYFGLPVTLGVCMWANRPVTAIAPKVTTQGHEYVQTVQLSEEPVFYTVEALVDPDIARMWVSFDPLPNGNEDVVVYYDGLVLAEGIRPLDEPPVRTPGE